MSDKRIRRVLMTCDTVGGVWTFALELAAGLATNGVEVVLAALGGHPSPDQTAAARRIPNLCLLASEFKLEWMENPWPDVIESGRWLTSLAREYAPDVIHLNSYGHGGLMFAQPVVLTAHSCVLSWWSAVKGASVPAEWTRYRSAVALAIHSADAVTAPSRFMAAAIEEHYRFDAALVRVIPNGRDPRRFRSARKEPFVLSAGRLWDEGKNAAALTGIAPSLSWPVYMAGDGRVEGCRSLGVLPADEIAGWYARASIYASPARYEPFGLSALEAALSGCALVLGDIPSLREVWGDAALFVPPDDGSALYNTIEALIGNVAFRNEMSQRSYARACKFPAGLMTDRYLHLYQTTAYGTSVCVS